jgi:diguanylate cyclase (GGDEF)-like protein/PAS domain S-box-containing protein
MFEVAPLAMAKVSTDGRLEAVNAALCSLLGEPERVLAGRRLSALVHPDDRSVLAGAGHPGRSGRGPASAEVRLVCTGGRLRWCELTSHLVRDLDGSPEYVLTSVVDITRHKRSEAALRDLATRDPLTGMANRRWFELDLARHLRACATSGSRGALLVVDIDRFKHVNDTLGHQVGDRLVMEVATTMRRHLRDQDLVARLGGDEFAVVLHEGDAGAAEAVARKLVRAVRDEVRTVGGEVDGPPRPRIRPIPRSGDRAVDLRAEPPAVVTVSVGVAPFQHFVVPGTPCPSGPELLRVADDAMYLVKRAGRDGYALAGNGAPQVHSRGRGRPGAVDVDLRGAAGGSRR